MMTENNKIQLKNQNDAPLVSKSLISDLRQIIEQARNNVANIVNSELTMMYWHIGERINREVLGNKRAEYGKQIVSTVSRQLSWSHFVEVISLKDSLRQEFLS